MQKTYPQLFKQGNYSDKLGDSATETIASSGCFLSSFAMKACFYGHNTNPSELNQSFNQKPHPIYVNGDLLPDNGLSLVFSDIKYIKTFDYEPIPTDLNNIRNLLSDASTTLTIRINLGNGNLHFVEAVDCDGNSLHIANPLTGNIEDFSQYYGNPVTANLHVIVYTGTPAVQAAPDPVQTVSSPLALRFNQAITKASNFDFVADFLGITVDQRVTTTAGLIVTEKIKELQRELDEANHRLFEISQQTPMSTPTPVATVTETSHVTGQTTTTPVFADGSTAVASTTSQTVLSKTTVTTQAPALSLLDRFLKTIIFWLG